MLIGSSRRWPGDAACQGTRSIFSGAILARRAVLGLFIMGSAAPAEWGRASRPGDPFAAGRRGPCWASSGRGGIEDHFRADAGPIDLFRQGSPLFCAGGLVGCDRRPCSVRRARLGGFVSSLPSFLLRDVLLQRSGGAGTRDRFFMETTLGGAPFFFFFWRGSPSHGADRRTLSDRFSAGGLLGGLAAGFVGPPRNGLLGKRCNGRPPSVRQ